MAKPNAAVADYVFARMTSMFGHRWTSAYGEDSRALPAMEWANALSGLTRSQVDAGFEATLLTGEEWPPSAPKFLERCMSIPTFAVVALEVQKGGAFSAFSREVWQALDTFCWRQASTERADRMLRNAYDLVHERVMRGEALPAAPVAAIEQEARKLVPATPEQRAGHAAIAKALFASGAS